MQIQISTDKHIQSSAEWAGQTHDYLASKLHRFENRITRIEAHFADENSAAKSGADDIRCLLEARLNGLDPLSVKEHAATVSQALHGATSKLISAIDSVLGKLDSRR